MRRRVRRSSVVLIAIFVVTLVAYVLVRPDPSPSHTTVPIQVTQTTTRATPPTT